MIIIKISYNKKNEFEKLIAELLYPTYYHDIDILDNKLFVQYTFKERLVINESIKYIKFSLKKNNEWSIDKILLEILSINPLKENKTIKTVFPLTEYIDMIDTINSLKYDKETIHYINETFLLLYELCNDIDHDTLIYTYINEKNKDKIKVSMKYIDSF